MIKAYIKDGDLCVENDSDGYSITHNAFTKGHTFKLSFPDLIIRDYRVGEEMYGRDIIPRQHMTVVDVYGTVYQYWGQDWRSVGHSCPLELSEDKPYTIIFLGNSYTPF